MILVEENGFADGSGRSGNAVAGVALSVENVPAGLNGLFLQVFRRHILSPIRVIAHDIAYGFTADDG